MGIKKVIFVAAAVFIMASALYVGITEERTKEAEQIFSEQIIRIEEAKEYSFKKEKDTILPLSNPGIVLITGGILAATLVISIIVAKKEGLFFISKKKENETYINEKPASKGIAV